MINTSNTTLGGLKEKIEGVFGCDAGKRSIAVNVISFGFKYGAPLEADLVFDVRFLPNPYYIEELRHQTGLDDAVYEYVFREGKAVTFLEKLIDMLLFLLLSLLLYKLLLLLSDLLLYKLLLLLQS